MIETLDKITKAYDESRLFNDMYENIKWYRNPQTLFLIFYFSSTIPIIIFTISNYPYFWIVWGLLVIAGFYIFINPIIKRTASKKFDIKANKGFFSLYINTDFKEKQLEKFFKNLMREKLIFNKMIDCSLIKEYALLFEKESTLSASSHNFIWGGGIFLVFLLPIWNTLIGKLINDSINFFETMRIISVLYLIICSLVYFLNILKYWLDDILNARSNKCLRVSRQLRLIALNLKLQNEIEKN